MTIGAANVNVTADAGHAACTPSCAFSSAAINQRMVSSPVNGTVIRWGFNVTSPNTSARLRVIRPKGTGALFVASSATESGLANGGHTFLASVSISIGDRIAVEPFLGSVGSVGDTFPLFGAAWEIYRPTPPDGSIGPLFASGFGHYFLVNADVEPSSTFTVGKPKLNKKRGTARLPVTVPNAGEVNFTGKGVAKGTISVSAPGTVDVPIRAIGKPKTRKLNRDGEVKVTPIINFTPTGGAVGNGHTQKPKMVLKKKL